MQQLHQNRMASPVFLEIRQLHSSSILNFKEKERDFRTTVGRAGKNNKILNNKKINKIKSNFWKIFRFIIEISFTIM